MVVLLLRLGPLQQNCWIEGVSLLQNIRFTAVFVLKRCSNCNYCSTLSLRIPNYQFRGVISIKLLPSIYKIAGVTDVYLIVFVTLIVRYARAIVEKLGECI